jgi:hypothetical protein
LALQSPDDLTIPVEYGLVAKITNFTYKKAYIAMTVRMKAKKMLVPIPIEVLEMSFQLLDQKVVDQLIREARRIDEESGRQLTEIAVRVGKGPYN